MKHRKPESMDKDHNGHETASHKGLGSRREGWFGAMYGAVDGRVWILAGLVCFFIVFALCLTLWKVNLMDMMGVLVMSPSFLDMRVVVGAWESARQGFDPLVFNPCDPGQRAMNYPRMWLLLERTGLDRTHVPLMGFILAAAFYLSVVGLLIEKRPGPRNALVWLLALLSPAVLLGVERGNIDLVIFVLFAVAAAGLACGRFVIRILGYLLLFMAAVLKLFPVFALVSCVKERPRVCLIVAAVFVVAFLLYVAEISDDAATILRTTERGSYVSYGNKVLFGYIDHMISNRWQGFASWDDPFVIALSWATTALVLIMAVAWLRQIVNPAHYAGGKHLTKFHIGAGIFLGTYLTGQNWDYRLMFLLFALPQVIEWMENKQTGRLPRFTLLLIIVALWSEFAVRWMPSRRAEDLTAILGEVVNWTLFAVMSFLLLATLPEWMRPTRLVAARRPK